jgi:hypothetical protein
MHQVTAEVNEGRIIPHVDCSPLNELQSHRGQSLQTISGPHSTPSPQLRRLHSLLDGGGYGVWRATDAELGNLSITISPGSCVARHET